MPDQHSLLGLNYHALGIDQFSSGLQAFCDRLIVRYLPGFDQHDKKTAVFSPKFQSHILPQPTHLCAHRLPSFPHHRSDFTPGSDFDFRPPVTWERQFSSCQRFKFQRFLAFQHFAASFPTLCWTVFPHTWNTIPLEVYTSPLAEKGCLISFLFVQGTDPHSIIWDPIVCQLPGILFG